MLILNVLKALNRSKVRYLVIGGVAGAFYGNPRFTKDLDIFADEKEGNLRKLIVAFKKLGFVTRIPVKPEEFLNPETRARWKKEKGMLAFTFINPRDPLENVDVLVEAPMSFLSAFKNKKYFLVENVRISVVSRKDLILMKRKAGRVQDLQDIAILEELEPTRKRAGSRR
jgi:predicted nucleotidyltransferase